MSRSEDEHAPQRHRLRVPAALAVAFVGSAAAVSVWYGGCEPVPPDPSPDARTLVIRDDASSDADADGPPDATVDAGPPAPDAAIDAPVDAAPPDTPMT